MLKLFRFIKSNRPDLFIYSKTAVMIFLENHHSAECIKHAVFTVCYPDVTNTKKYNR